MWHFPTKTSGANAPVRPPPISGPRHICTHVYLDFTFYDTKYNPDKPCPKGRSNPMHLNFRK